MCQRRFNIAVQSTAPGLELHCSIDGLNTTIYHSTPGAGSISLMFEDRGGHKIHLTMIGKQPDDTELDECGNIVEDKTIEISGAWLDGVDIHDIFLAKSFYHHSYNSGVKPVCGKFDGVMGWNGEVTMSWDSPCDLWLLERL